MVFVSESLRVLPSLDQLVSGAGSPTISTSKLSDSPTLIVISLRLFLSILGLSAL